MATLSSVLAWRIPGRGSLVGCRLWGRRVRHDWSDLAAAAAAVSKHPYLIFRSISAILSALPFLTAFFFFLLLLESAWQAPPKPCRGLIRTELNLDIKLGRADSLTHFFPWVVIWLCPWRYIYFYLTPFSYLPELPWDLSIFEHCTHIIWSWPYCALLKVNYDIT